MNRKVNRRLLETALATLLSTNTQVPEGETEILPGDPRIIAAVDDVVLPMISALGPDEIRRHPSGDVAARFGPDGDEGFLIQTYIVSQHANLMDDKNVGSILDGSAYGYEGPVAVGQGATQGKGAMASAIAAMAARPSNLTSPVWLSANTEGRSSHGGSSRILDDLSVTASHGVVLVGTDLRVSLGNRGRVDVLLHIKGKSAHSSQPWLGSNPIPSGAAAIIALQTLEVPDEHPSLGPVTVTPYRFISFPVAPHTIPQEVTIVIDRRLLPGEIPTEAVEAIANHLRASGSNDVEVVEDVSMLSAEVDEDSRIVSAFKNALRNEGEAAKVFWSLNCFDAGYACSKGIPTPMFGPGKRQFTGDGLIRADAVGVNDCHIAASVLVRVIDELCGSGRG